ARGEVWQFDELMSETRLRVDGRLLYLDRFAIRPGEQPPTTEWTMGRMHYLATALCVDPRAEKLAEQLHKSLPSAGVDTPAAGMLAARIPSGCGTEYHHSRTTFFSVMKSMAECVGAAVAAKM